MSYIRWFCRSKKGLLKEKKDTLVVFKKSKNENVFKKKEKLKRETLIIFLISFQDYNGQTILKERLIDTKTCTTVIKK